MAGDGIDPDPEKGQTPGPQVAQHDLHGHGQQGTEYKVLQRFHRAAADNLVIDGHHKQGRGQGQDIDQEADHKGLQEDGVKPFDQLTKPFQGVFTGIGADSISGNGFLGQGGKSIEGAAAFADFPYRLDGVIGWVVHLASGSFCIGKQDVGDIIFADKETGG